MRIRNRCLPLNYSLIHQSDTAALTTNQLQPALPPVVMISRINGGISSKGDAASEKEIDSAEPAKDIIVEMNISTQANQSWCEEERVIPLKKRRISFERNLIPEKDKEINDNDVSEETKMEELRYRRTDGKKWRCRRRRIEGYSMCAQHLEREKQSRSRVCRRSHRLRNQKTAIAEDENEDDKKKKKKKKIMKQVMKSRSVNSLIRNTVPLMLHLNSVIN